MNDIIATIMFILGVGLLTFSYVWYRVTIRPNPCQDENIPLVAFNEMRKDK